MKKGQALRPNFFIEKLAEIKKENRGSDDEKHLYALSKHKGWSIYREFINDLLNDLDIINQQAIDNGLGYEQLGYNAVVINQVKKIINRGFLKIDDAIEAVEKPNGIK